MDDQFDDLPEEFKKTARIKKEREKAARALEKDASLRINSTYLDPASKPHGYTWDIDALRRSDERLSNIGSIMAFGGIIMDFFAKIITFNVGGDASKMINMTVGSVGLVLLVLGSLFSLVAFFMGWICQAKTRGAFNHGIATSAIAIAAVGIYFLLSGIIL